MTKFVQIHLLTVYPISCPNRDDMGLPKTISVGGTTRGFISSQSRKSDLRNSTPMIEAFHNKSTRTRFEGVSGIVAEVLVGYPPDTVKKTTNAIIKALANKKASNDTTSAASANAKKSSKKKKQTVEADEDTSSANAETVESKDGADVTADGTSTKKAADPQLKQLVAFSDLEIANIKELAKKHAEDDTTNITIDDILQRVETGMPSLDVAMHGRMVAQAPEYNIEAAIQVAPSFTTHASSVEEDYFAAVDDLVAQGAGHINSQYLTGGGVYYTYIVVDMALLTKNLCGDAPLAVKVVRESVDTLMQLSSRGKQATYASRTRSAYARVEHGNSSPYTGADAFNRAVTGSDLFVASVERLSRFRKQSANSFQSNLTVAEFVSEELMDDLCNPERTKNVVSNTTWFANSLIVKSEIVDFVASGAPTVQNVVAMPQAAEAAGA